MTKGISSTLEYNWDGKLSDVNDSEGNPLISLKYDPLGNRIYKWSCEYGTPVNGTRYIVDISGELPTILMELYNSGGSVMNKYYYAGAEVLAKYTGGNTQYYIHDRLGSVRLAIVGTTSSESYNYTPFGEDMNSVEYVYSHNPMKFTGQWYDHETGQYYLRARMYDPQLGRFTGRDPVAGKLQRPLTLHKYLYCLNDPLNKIDLTGKTASQIVGGLLAGTAVRSAATCVMVEGINRNSDQLINVGMQMHHLVAPAMVLGIILGPITGELAINVGASAWSALTTGITNVAGFSYEVAREAALYAMAHPRQTAYAMDNFVDAVGVFCEEPAPPHTPAGAIALSIKWYIENDD